VTTAHISITGIDESLDKEDEGEGSRCYPDSIPKHLPPIRLFLDIWLDGISIWWKIFVGNCWGHISSSLMTLDAWLLGREQRLTLWIIR